MYDIEHIQNRIKSVADLLQHAEKEVRGIHSQLEHEEEGVARPPRVWQRNPQYRYRQYTVTSNETFGSAGCLVCCVYSVARLAGFVGTLPEFAGAIDKAGAFKDGELSNQVAVCKVVPTLRWHSKLVLPGEYDSFISWRCAPADLAALAQMLDCYPVAIQVDFVPGTRVVDRHYVVAYRYCPPSGGDSIEDDLFVMDPWTGTYTSVLTYFSPSWLTDGTMATGVTKVQRTIYGARVWEISQ